MNLSLLLILSDSGEKNQKTLEFLNKEFRSIKGSIQLLVYGTKEQLESFGDMTGQGVLLEKLDRTSVGAGRDADLFADAAGRMNGDYLTQMYGGDLWSEGALSFVDKQKDKLADANAIIMLKKILPDGETGAFSGREIENLPASKNWTELSRCHPFYMGGTFVCAELVREYGFHPELGIETEREFLLRSCIAKKRILMIGKCSYFSSVEREGDPVFYEGIYDPAWYEESFTKFWMPFLGSMEKAGKEIPAFVQFDLMFSIKSRIESNINNTNKHVIPEGREKHCLELIGRTLAYVEDRVMFNYMKNVNSDVADSMKWLYGVLKYGKDFRFDSFFLGGNRYYGAGTILFNTARNLKTTIVFMNYQNHCLEVDGLVHPVLFAMANEVYISFNDKKYPLQYNGRYAITKIFGVSVYKSHSFHVSLPTDEIKDTHLFCMARFGRELTKIFLGYDSHFSRMSNRFHNCYWHFDSYLCTLDSDGIRFCKCDNIKKAAKRQEWKLDWEMFRSFKKKSWVFLAIRRAYFATRPFIKNKQVWMYLDKIYKGGDSSEYLFRYASAQKDKNIRHYYLIDKKTTDYKRLKKDGFRPLVRGSIKHRLIFLMADMMVISNSTVFAFNDFGMVNSSYVRDLVDFHVCCVQHGMSVQKIAVAQNRLRDNTRLYFCESFYEFKNLYKPIYDYRGYNALKLTGVPRYDGLVNDDKRQIMISPTWRMQAAVPVRTNEGQQRDYNPLFKESTYYKVFNALINDTRLIEAAKKYGYKIKYVLHPIVSSQVDDFDRNEYVDIVPAVGDMSYERMFCESSLMVTDFSGIQFDFAYMRKPVVYLHHKDIPQHYEEGSFYYDTMAFGEICHDNDELIDLLCEYMSNDCRMKEQYVRRADDFFYFDDHSNCERIYREMIDYQNKYILKNTPKAKQEYLQGIFDPLERERLRKTYIKKQKERGEEPAGYTITDDYYRLPLREKAILLLGLGKNVRGNMQYILNEINSNDDFAGYTAYVRTSEETDAIVQEYIKKNHWTRTETIPTNKGYPALMESAKYLITEVYFPEGWVKRPGQVYINIWHGTPLKKLGLAKNSKNIHKDGNTQRNFIEADYLLYPNEYTMKNMLASYKVSELMTGKALMLGYPRTGGLMDEADSDLTELKKELAPNGERLYAYMPTWKDYLKVDQVVQESKELLDYLDANMAEDQLLYVNLHHKVSDSLDYSVYRHIRQFPPVVDNYALLAATEALITDYSSVFYDYLATRKQIILYCADYELYRKKRGTYMDLMELPFDKAKTAAEVLEAMNRGKTYNDEAAYQEFCGYDSIENAKKLCSLLLNGNHENLDIVDIPKTDRKKVLIYSESCQAGTATDLLRELCGSYDQTRSQIYISCEMFSVDKNKKSAYPMLFDVPVIGTVSDPHLSGVGKKILEEYRDGTRSFDEAVEYLQYDYAVELYRMYGQARFDVLAIYDLLDPERVITLSLMQTNKYLFVNQRMLERAEEDVFLCKALEFAARRVKGVCVENKQQIQQTAELLHYDGTPEVIDSVQSLTHLLVI